MSNIEYIFEFAKKHNFPKTECEVVFNTIDDGSGNDIYTTDDDIIAVRFDKSLVENEIKMEDIRFDIDSDFPEDVFFMWQKEGSEVSFKKWISSGGYNPIPIQNDEYFGELNRLSKEIEMKLGSLFANIEEDNGDSNEYDEDSDFYEDDIEDIEEDEDGEDD